MWGLRVREPLSGENMNNKANKDNVNHPTENNIIAEQWWDIRKAAGYLSMSVAFLRKAVRERRIPFCRIGSKCLRFRKQDLDEWMKTNGSDGELSYAE
jgi:excisionase family DNA binding protein